MMENKTPYQELLENGQFDELLDLMNCRKKHGCEKCEDCMGCDDPMLGIHNERKN